MTAKPDSAETSLGWERALLLLSLERALPFWNDLGLAFQSPERVQKLVRATVRAQQALQDAPGDDPAQPAKEAALRADLLAKVGAVEGQAGASALRDWVEREYVPLARPEPWRGAWRTLLARLAEPQEALALSHEGMPPEKVARLADVAAAWRRARDQIGERIEAAERLPLAGWDQQQYERYRRDDPDVSPLDALSQHLKARRFAEVWRQVVGLLGPDDLDRLVRWALPRAPRMGFAPDAVALPPEARAP
jgi:hypothetical protein